MISESFVFNYDKVFYRLLESNDHEFSQGRVVMKFEKQDNKINITINAKDDSSFRAMKKSLNNTQLVLNKVRGVI